MQDHTQVADNNLHLINHFRKSLLFNNGEVLKKELSDSQFDVTKGRLILLDHIYRKEGCRTIKRRWTNHLATVKWTTTRQNQKMYHTNIQIFWF